MVTARIARRVLAPVGLGTRASAEHAWSRRTQATCARRRPDHEQTSFYRRQAHFRRARDTLGGSSHGEPAPRERGLLLRSEPYTMASPPSQADVAGAHPHDGPLDARARHRQAGRYPFAEAADIPKQKLATHFAREGPGRRQPELRARVAFAQLISATRGRCGAIRGHLLPQRRDLLRSGDADRLVARFRELLSPGGLLFIRARQGLVGDTGFGSSRPVCRR